MDKEFNDLIVTTYNTTVEYVKTARIVNTELGTNSRKNVNPNEFHSYVKQSNEKCEEAIKEIRRLAAADFDVYKQQEIIRTYERALDLIRLIDKQDEQYQTTDADKLEETLEDVRTSRIFNFRQVGEAQFNSSLNNISAKLLQVEKLYQDGKISPEKAKKHVLKLKNTYESMANRVTEFNKDTYERMGRLINYYSETYIKEPLAEQTTETAVLDEQIVPEVRTAMQDGNSSVESFMSLLKILANSTKTQPIDIDSYDLQEKMKKILMMFEERHIDWDYLDYEVRQLYRMAETVKNHKDNVNAKLENKAKGLEFLFAVGEGTSNKLETNTATSIYAQTLHEIEILENQLNEVKEAFLSGNNYPKTIALHHFGYIQSQVRFHKQNLALMATSVKEKIPEELRTRLNALGENVKNTAVELGLLTLKDDSVSR